jgi:hypothetical protein
VLTARGSLVALHQFVKLKQGRDVRKVGRVLCIQGRRLVMRGRAHEARDPSGQETSNARQLGNVVVDNNNGEDYEENKRCLIHAFFDLAVDVASYDTLNQQ